MYTVGCIEGAILNEVHCQRRPKERKNNAWSIFETDSINIRIHTKLKKKPDSTFSPA